MEEILDVSAYPHGSTVLVELTGRDATGELVVASYEFDVDDADETVVRPRGTIEDTHEAPIRDVLSSDGYTLLAD